jgi:hypothetical protein
MEAAAAHTDARVLVVADWRADAHAVAMVAERRALEHDAVFSVVVPAWLHGLDWMGDPRASRPCAQAQVDALVRMWADRELPLVKAMVGDPDPVAAVDDALEQWPADEILVLARSANPTPIHPLAIARRIEHATGLPTRRISVGARQVARERFGWIRHGGRHCAADMAHTA